MLQCQQRVNKLLDTHLDQDIPSQTLRDAMIYACVGGAKRIRPALVYGSARRWILNWIEQTMRPVP